MITALFLVVAISVVALQFSIVAHERYTLGIAASERGIARAAAVGALALEQSRLERALRTQNTSNNASRLRSSDPWVDVDSLYSGDVDIDSVPVTVEVKVGGTRLNINSMTQQQFQTFFGYLLNDYALSDQIAQSIMDWRDLDEQARVRGAEREAYLKEHKLVLPANAPFREVDDLIDVQGITPEILALARPYLTTHGNSPINLNAADKYVLRAIPGMTDAVLTRILALRSQGGRIRSMADVGIPQQQPGRPPTAQQTLGQNIASNSTVDTQEVELIITAQAGVQAMPARLNATITRTGTNARVTWRQW
jgi:type II secretory pathway component PulK